MSERLASMTQFVWNWVGEREGGKKETQNRKGMKGKEEAREEKKLNAGKSEWSNEPHATS